MPWNGSKRKESERPEKNQYHPMELYEIQKCFLFVGTLLTDKDMSER